MKAAIIDGKSIAGSINEKNRERVLAFFNSFGRYPKLAVIIVGEDPASQIYVRNKERACGRINMESEVIRFPEDTPQCDVESCIEKLNCDPHVDGILVQLPLPGSFDERRIMSRISSEKDVDGFHVYNLGGLISGQEGFIPCTPKGIMRLIHETNVSLDGKHAVVIGRSTIVGKPVAQLLLRENCTVTTCHSHTKDLESFVRQADILVVSIGRTEFVKGSWIKEGAIVIDVGINRTEHGLKGDVEFESAAEHAAYITPVPGGVGPMTIAMLLDNTLAGAIAHETKYNCK
ncbi:MAG: bifunctional methylenetetrahydrofolate dehydrogenase/methenyltetrahydrofolate cyclohydrolase FolD [Clostridia bacterium]|nr:bifunctional methylenetetrahydrofolate dehydrogenase/methenyltetrahydrofolate cyclohydrolase FolD [Clostridia bacterium]